MLVTREPLTSLEERQNYQSPSARAVSEFISVAVRTVLEAYDWTFASKRTKIVPSKEYTTDEETFNGNIEYYTMGWLGWRYLYVLPANFIGQLRIYTNDWTRLIDNDWCNKAQLWWLEGKKLCSNIANSELNVEYCFYDKNELNIPATVELCMIYYLAHLIAPVLTGSNAASEQWLRLYTITLTNAKDADTNKRAKILRDNNNLWTLDWM